jgi:hypothetical protein
LRRSLWHSRAAQRRLRVQLRSRCRRRVKFRCPIGQEAKGIVLPDYNLQGQLQARFEAASAKRISEQELQFTGLKVTTFTPENTPDVLIDVPMSVLDVETRILTARQRTTVHRAT